MPNPNDSQFSHFVPYEAAKDEEYMNEPQKDHFRDILLAWKKQLMEEVDSTIHHLQEEASNFADPSDRASQEEEFSLELRTRDRERKLIKKSMKPWNVSTTTNTATAMPAVLKLVFAV